jgi:hypothetical protein
MSNVAPSPSRQSFDAGAWWPARIARIERDSIGLDLS